MKTLRDYQVADLAYYMAHPKCMNLSDPGVGKTLSVVVMQWHLWANHGVRTVWVMPKQLMKKNRLEILDGTPFQPEDVAIVNSNEIPANAKVVLMGFRRFTLLVTKLVEMGFGALHVDEFHMGFAGPKSQATLAMYAFMEKAQWFIAMTGTLVNGRMDTAYPAIHVIEPRYYMSHEHFENYHTYKVDGKVVAWINGAKLAEIFGRHAIRRTFAQVHGEQEIVTQHELVEMTPAQRAMYQQFEEQAYLELERFFVDGTMPGVATLRARQIMEHPNEFPDLTEPGKFIDILKGERPMKEQLLEVHLEDHVRTGMPFVMFSAMIPQHNRLYKLAEERRMTVEVMNGGVSQKVRDRIDEDFQAGKIQVLVCSPMVASVGYNWQFWGGKEVDHAAFVSMDYRDTSFFQARQRFIRGKRSTPLRLTVLEYEDSIDQRVFEINRKKAAMANGIDPTREKLDFRAA